MLLNFGQSTATLLDLLDLNLNCFYSSIAYNVLKCLEQKSANDIYFG